MRGFGLQHVEPGSSAEADVDATLFAMNLASAPEVPVPVGRISALLHRLTVPRRQQRTNPVVPPASTPIRFGGSYRWPDGSWTHSR